MPDVPTRTSGTGNIAQRAETLDGKARWSRPDGGGTLLDWRIPLRPPRCQTGDLPQVGEVPSPK